MAENSDQGSPVPELRGSTQVLPVVECSPVARHRGPGFLESCELQIFTSMVLKVWSLDPHD